MLKLNLSTAAKWIDLGNGVRIKCRPMSTSLMLAARATPEVVAAAKPGDDGNPPDDQVVAQIAAKALGRIAIEDWEGVGDADGNPVPVTPAGVDALLEIWPIFEAFNERYVLTGFLLDAEKNGSAPSPRGSSARARATVKTARKSAKTARAK